ncbi:hypothetical protein V8F06_006296 [Rhypophila decipiens]
MLSAGHQIGIHGWSHINMSPIDNATRYREIHDLEVALFNILGKIPTYFRPPYGDCNIQCITQLHDMGYHVVGWDLDTRDWEYTTEATWELALKKFKSRHNDKHGDNHLVLMHDVQQMTASDLLPAVLQSLKNDNHDRLNVTVGDCLFDPPQNWYRLPGRDWDRNPS